MISKQAVISPKAKVDERVTIGHFSVIGDDVEIGAGTWIGPHVVMKGSTRIGRDNKIFQFASIGEDPQDKKYQGEKTALEIGDRNVIREFVTLNRGTAQDIGTTRIGNDNLFMSYVHVAHDCQIGNNTIFVNNSSLAGHVKVEDYVILGGFSAIYQFCQLGMHSFIAGGALVIKDVLPYTRVAGSYAKPCGLNVEGLRRRGFTQEQRNLLKEAYRVVYRMGQTIPEAVSQLGTMRDRLPEVDNFIRILQTAKHGVTR
jgi:UDP-N-acetylglucosamine acyltransferase